MPVRDMFANHNILLADAPHLYLVSCLNKMARMDPFRRRGFLHVYSHCHHTMI